jgi:hypothetical protein
MISLFLPSRLVSSLTSSEMMATRDVACAIKLFATAFRTYGEVSKAVDVEGCPSDPFWAEPGNGWGLKTVDC